jgi:ribonuclease P protein component
MLPKDKRVPRKMFSLLSPAKTVNTSLFLLKFVLLKGKEKRFCFSVSKKVAKNAVVRNRWRRKGYHFLEKYIPEIKNGTLAVFYFKMLPKNDEEIMRNLKLILEKSKITE